MDLIIGSAPPSYEAVQDEASGQWLVLENDRPMAVGASEADARFLAQAAGALRSGLITKVGPLFVIARSDN